MGLQRTETLYLHPAALGRLKVYGLVTEEEFDVHG
jgi:hypothetical protein